MEQKAIVAGTGYENRDGTSRADIIRACIKNEQSVTLEREPDNQHDENAIAVYIDIPVLFGLLGKSRKQIGYIKAGTAKSLAKKMDEGLKLRGYVDSYYAPKGRNAPRVTLRLEY